MMASYKNMCSLKYASAHSDSLLKYQTPLKSVEMKGEKQAFQQALKELCQKVLKNVETQLQVIEAATCHNPTEGK